MLKHFEVITFIRIDSVDRFIDSPDWFDGHDVYASVVSINAVVFIYGGSQRIEVLIGEMRDRAPACLLMDSSHRVHFRTVTCHVESYAECTFVLSHVTSRATLSAPSYCHMSCRLPR